MNVTTEIVAKRESKSRPDAGIVDFIHRAYKQDGTLVAECRRQAFMRKRTGSAVMRSLLFVPGDSPRKLEKAPDVGRRRAHHRSRGFGRAVRARTRRGASRRSSSRAAATAAERPRLFVRVNGLTTGLIDADLDGVMPAGPDGIVLPKTVGGADVSHLGAKLAVREAEFGLADGATRILAIATENAAGIFALGTFAGASHRLMGLDLGRRGSVGRSRRRDEPGRRRRLHRALPPRPRPSRCSARPPPSVDADRFRLHQFPRPRRALDAECREARRDGFVAKMAIHPAQVPVINEAFTPSAEAIARAQAVIEAFAANPGAGVVGVEGEMLDRPHLLRAERLLRRAGQS